MGRVANVADEEREQRWRVTLADGTGATIELRLEPLCEVERWNAYVALGGRPQVSCGGHTRTAFEALTRALRALAEDLDSEPAEIVRAGEPTRAELLETVAAMVPELPTCGVCCRPATRAIRKMSLRHWACDAADCVGHDAGLYRELPYATAVRALARREDPRG
jgi:hypothetical protein